MLSVRSQRDCAVAVATAGFLPAVGGMPTAAVRSELLATARSTLLPAVRDTALTAARTGILTVARACPPYGRALLSPRPEWPLWRQRELARSLRLKLGRALAEAGNIFAAS